MYQDVLTRAPLCLARSKSRFTESSHTTSQNTGRVWTSETDCHDPLRQVDDTPRSQRVELSNPSSSLLHYRIHWLFFAIVMLQSEPIPLSRFLRITRSRTIPSLLRKDQETNLLQSNQGKTRQSFVRNPVHLANYLVLNRLHGVQSLTTAYSTPRPIWIRSLSMRNDSTREKVQSF